MHDLRHRMIMALSAADIANPLCEQAAEICAEIAEQHCAELHVARPVEEVSLEHDPLAGAASVARTEHHA